MDFSASFRFGLLGTSSDKLFFFLLFLREKVNSVFNIDITLRDGFFALSFGKFLIGKKSENYTVANHCFLLLHDDEKVQLLDDVGGFLRFGGVVQIQYDFLERQDAPQQLCGVLQLE